MRCLVVSPCPVLDGAHHVLAVEHDGPAGALGAVAGLGQRWSAEQPDDGRREGRIGGGEVLELGDVLGGDRDTLEVVPDVGGQALGGGGDELGVLLGADLQLRRVGVGVQLARGGELALGGHRVALALGDEAQVVVRLRGLVLDLAQRLELAPGLGEPAQLPQGAGLLVARLVGIDAALDRLLGPFHCECGSAQVVEGRGRQQRQARGAHLVCLLDGDGVAALGVGQPELVEVAGGGQALQVQLGGTLQRVERVGIQRQRAGVGGAGLVQAVEGHEIPAALAVGGGGIRRGAAGLRRTRQRAGVVAFVVVGASPRQVVAVSGGAGRQGRGPVGAGSGPAVLGPRVSARAEQTRAAGQSEQSEYGKEVTHPVADPRGRAAGSATGPPPSWSAAAFSP